MKLFPHYEVFILRVDVSTIPSFSAWMEKNCAVQPNNDATWKLMINDSLHNRSCKSFI